MSEPVAAASQVERPYVELHETHSGAVLLMGDLAFKFKKPVDLGFLDFSRIADRWSVCRREVELNRRLSPDVYLGVGRLETAEGSGEPAVVMRRMPAERRLSQLVADRHATPAMVRDTARQVAAFHSRAERGVVISAEGTRNAIRGRWEASFAQCRPFVSTVFDETLIADIETRVRSFLVGRRPLFDDRVAQGRVVDGHGDLIADDIYCLPDGPRILDCLEFDDRLRYLDQLDDVAFLAMDLQHLGATALATTFLEAYVEFAGDPAPPALLHHFLAYRAFVRAKVSAFRAAQRGATGDALRDAGQFADLTQRHLREGEVSLVLVGGPPGTGKTTLAGGIADQLGMVVLSSDRIRKELAGLDPLAPAAAPFAQGIYEPVWTDRTYRELVSRAGRLLELGESVVLDASWVDQDRRRAAVRVAETAAAHLVMLRCSLDAHAAAARLRNRAGSSDADARIAAALRRSESPWPDSIEIDTSQAPADAVRAAARAIRPTASVSAPRRYSRLPPD